MNKIDKLDKELEKAREKAAEWQAKIRELEKQKQGIMTSLLYMERQVD